MYTCVPKTLITWSLKTKTIRILKKMKKKRLEISFYKCVAKTTIIRVRFLRYGVRLTYFFVILALFSPFTPPPLTTRKIKILKIKRMKKMPWDFIILHMCTINEKMIKNDSSDKECDRQKFFSFWDIFCLFTPLTNNPQNQNF